MTAHTARPECSAMLISMAGITCRRCALEHIVFMTLGTGHIPMRTCQFKYRQVMVERSRLPGSSCMTAHTARPECSAMLICMAGIAGRRCALENIVFMTLGAGNIAMRTGQLKT